MPADDYLTDVHPTISLETFWEWVTAHPNCIVRAGTQTAVLFDDEEYHWHLAREADGALLTQVVRGKRLVGELVIPPDRVAFVQGGLGDHEGEFLFEWIGGDDPQRSVVAFFVMAHGLESETEESRKSVH